MAAKDLYEKDYYQILGVSKGADSAAIKKQYRKLARELHPDKTKGDKKLEDRFKAVSEAYDILSDDKKRRDYDEVREAVKSGRVPPGFNGGGQGFNGGDFSDLFGPGGDIFSTLFGGARQRHGADLQTEASIGFKESIYGTELNLRLSPNGSTPTNITLGNLMISREDVKSTSTIAVDGSDLATYVVSLASASDNIYETTGSGDVYRYDRAYLKTPNNALGYLNKQIFEVSDSDGSSSTIKITIPQKSWTGARTSTATLSTDVTFFNLFIAILKANLAMRLISFSEYFIVLKASLPLLLLLKPLDQELSLVKVDRKLTS